MILTDSGPLISIIDRKDEDHSLCVGMLAELRGPMVTSWPALTEAIYLLGARAGWKAQDALLRLVVRGDVAVRELEVAGIGRCRSLMERYRSLPMDFADATLVVIAESLKSRRIFTLDSHFHVYRIGGRAAFDVIPAL